MAQPPAGYLSNQPYPVNEVNSAGPYPNYPQYPAYSVAPPGYPVYGPQTRIRRDNNTQTNLFRDPYTRRAFILKVYLLLVVQLLAEAGIIWTIINVDEVVDFLSDKKNEWLFYVAVATPFGTYIALTYCCVSLRRKVPYNYIFLFIWTLPFGFTYGYFSAYKEIDPTMFTAMMITADACLGVTLVIFVPKCQFKALTGLFSVFGTFCTVYALVYSHFPFDHEIFPWVVAFYLPPCLVLDTILLMDGRKQYKYIISPEEYVFAASCLFVDIIGCYILTWGLIQLGRGRRRRRGIIINVQGVVNRA